jgi:hypothetical protein
MAGHHRLLLLGSSLVLLFGSGPVSPAAEPATPANARRATLKEIMIRHHPFTIDPKTPLRDLLPVPPKYTPPGLPLLNYDLARVPEVMMYDPASIALKRPSSKDDKKESEVKRHIAFELEEFVEKQIAHQIAKINHLNKQKRDHFLTTLLAQRADLAGLPFVMGDACRQDKNRSKAFFRGVDQVRRAFSFKATSDTADKEYARQYWDHWKSQRETEKPATEELVHAQIAALKQMLTADSTAMQVGLVKHLSEQTTAEVNEILARLAVFSPHAEVRRAAIAAIEKRRDPMHDETLLRGLRYPYPPVAANAADAIVALKRKDLAPQLVRLLEEPDPRAPYSTKVDGKRATVVRELVKINHHRNCLLCHAPGNTPDLADKIFGDEILLAPVPLPGQPFPSSNGGYGSFRSPDILVRVDVTYLRQDFSMQFPVADAKPWPDMQRFDFVVRTRVLDKKDAAFFRTVLARAGASPYHAAAHSALKALTGRDAEANAAAWRTALALTKS